MPLHRRHVAPVFFATIAVAALTACSASPTSAPTEEPPAAEPSATATPSTSAAPTEAGACDLLDEADIISLLGESMEGTEITVPGSTLPACQYGTLGELGIQVAQTPAEEWAESLPMIVEAALALPEGALDASLRAQLEEASEAVASGAAIEPDEACAYFSQLLEVAGQEPGVTATINYLPDLDTAIAVSGQQCENGVYTSVLVSREGLPTDETIVDEVTTLLEQLS